MKKLFPLLSLAALIAAAGSAAGVANTKEPVSAAPADEADTALESFCSQYWGTMTGGLCRFEQTYHFNRVHVGSLPMLTGIPVIASDSLSVLASEGAMPKIGNRIYSSRAFYSESEGYLSFLPAAGSDAFSLRQVSLRRCFTDAGGNIESARCPL